MTLSTWTIAQSTAGLSPATSARFDAAVRHEIVQLVDGYKKEAAAYSPATSIMWERILASLEGGKLTRPRLVRLGYDAFAPQRRQEQPAEKRVVLLGCAFELLHTSLLMHDDVIDRDFTRRGRPTLSAQYRDDALAAGRVGPTRTMPVILPRSLPETCSSPRRLRWHCVPAPHWIMPAPLNGPFNWPSTMLAPES